SVEAGIRSSLSDAWPWTHTCLQDKPSTSSKLGEVGVRERCPLCCFQVSAASCNKHGVPMFQCWSRLGSFCSNRMKKVMNQHASKNTGVCHS
ncbi:hypothetical protein LEMLEM_LOCUS22973, partial [Lemmus lemmus]